jgi:DNA processing protein
MTGMAALDDRERLARLRLSLTESVGPLTFRRLLERYGAATRALEALPELARRGGRKSIALAKESEARQELESLYHMGGRLLCLDEPDYPPALAAVEDAPPVLRVLGRSDLLAGPTAVAIVGARNASLNGRRFAESLAAELAAAGLVVVSGLARGIDASAHAGALAKGATIAVLAGGADIIYPRENEALHRHIAAEGALVAERPLGSIPRERDFPRRNRVISGLCHGVVVVEAARRSGSLITARLALEQGRDVFAVPGSPLDARCEGTNDLLKQGATLVTTAADVLDNLPRAIPAPPQKPSRGPEPTLPLKAGPKEFQPVENITEIVLQALGPAPLPVDELLRRCQLSPGDVANILLELELAGRIQRHPGNLVSVLED